MPKILIIEDESYINEELQILLENSGYVVRGIPGEGDAAEEVRIWHPDLVLLDINLPGKDGFTVCAAVRRFSDVPILFITGRNTTVDEVKALMVGGDDFIAKPYNIPVLMARVQRLLRRQEAAAPAEELEHNGVVLKPVKALLEGKDGSADLSKTELQIIYYLFRHAGQYVPRIELIEFLWDEDIHIDDNTLSVNMTRLREKLRLVGAADFVRTKRGMGYKI